MARIIEYNKAPDLVFCHFVRFRWLFYEEKNGLQNGMQEIRIPAV